MVGGERREAGVRLPRRQPQRVAGAERCALVLAGRQEAKAPREGLEEGHPQDVVRRLDAHKAEYSLTEDQRRR